MPIAFDCSCGKTLRVPDEFAGRRAKCPACAAVLTVPLPEPQFEIVEEPPPPPPRAGAARHGELPAPKPVVDDDSDDGSTYGLAKPDRNDDDDSGAGPRKGTGKPKGKSGGPGGGLPNFRKGTDNYQ
ncbi:MAG: hypothetical protein FJ304_04405 [Planctomycetes bacterium]|nr:hypothetical protein [Planctomycetota bacterium]